MMKGQEVMVRGRIVEVGIGGTRFRVDFNPRELAIEPTWVDPSRCEPATNEDPRAALDAERAMSARLAVAVWRALASHEDIGCSCNGCARLRDALAAHRARSGGDATPSPSADKACGDDEKERGT